MSEPTNKAQLLDLVRSGYAAFEDLLAPLSEAQLTTPGVNGDWSIKDVLVHLATWQQRADIRVQAALRNTAPDQEPITNDEEMNRFNDETFAQNRQRPLAEVQNDFRTSYQQLLADAEALSENDLFDSDRFPWMKGTAIWQLLEGDTYGHYDEHKPPIEAWLSSTK